MSFGQSSFYNYNVIVIKKGGMSRIKSKELYVRVLTEKYKTLLEEINESPNQ